MSCCRSIAPLNNWCPPQQCCPPPIVIPQNTQFYNYAAGYQNCFNAPCYVPAGYCQTPYYQQAAYPCARAPYPRYPTLCFSGWC